MLKEVQCFSLNVWNGVLKRQRSLHNQKCWEHLGLCNDHSTNVTLGPHLPNHMLGPRVFLFIYFLLRPSREHWCVSSFAFSLHFFTVFTISQIKRQKPEDYSPGASPPIAALPLKYERNYFFKSQTPEETTTSGKTDTALDKYKECNLWFNLSQILCSRYKSQQQRVLEILST